MSAVAFSVKTRPSFWNREGPPPVAAEVIVVRRREEDGMAAFGVCRGATESLAMLLLAGHVRASLSARIVGCESEKTKKTERGKVWRTMEFEKWLVFFFFFFFSDSALSSSPSVSFFRIPVHLIILHSQRPLDLVDYPSLPSVPDPVNHGERAEERWRGRGGSFSLSATLLLLRRRCSLGEQERNAAQRPRRLPVLLRNVVRHCERRQ